MAESRELAGPVVGGRAGFHANQAGRQARKELHKLGAPDLPADGNPALSINGMDLKHRFGEVQANCCDLSPDLRSLSSILNGLILAPSGAGAIHPIVNGNRSGPKPFGELIGFDQYEGLAQDLLLSEREIERIGNPFDRREIWRLVLGHQMPHDYALTHYSFCASTMRWT